jgi:hypothetical protein
LFQFRIRVGADLHRPPAGVDGGAAIERLLCAPVIRERNSLLISTVMLAAKYIDDFFYKNEVYAKIGGVSKQLINEL